MTSIRSIALLSGRLFILLALLAGLTLPGGQAFAAPAGHDAAASRPMALAEPGADPDFYKMKVR